MPHNLSVPTGDRDDRAEAIPMRGLTLPDACPDRTIGGPARCAFCRRGIPHPSEDAAGDVFEPAGQVTG
jgi:hypothetical protein